MTNLRVTGLPLSQLLAGWADIAGDSAMEVKGLCLDSRKVQPGDLFFALAGSQSHGIRHAEAAAAAGACAILYDPAAGGADLAPTNLSIPCIPVNDLGQCIGFIADRFFGEPSLHMDVIGITGTNGKTSCSHFLATALAHNGPSAVVGTLGWGLPGSLHPTDHTTPDAIEVHCLLAKLRARSFATVAMEASSHGLHQGRLNGIRFEGGLFTNLSRDHLDYHLTMESYLEAKLRLVSWPGLKFIAFNLDDESAKAVMARAEGPIRKIGYTLDESHVPVNGIEIVQASSIKHSQHGISFDVHFGKQAARIFAPLFGSFNVENLMGVIAVLLAKGFPLTEITQRLEKVSAVPGRMERFCSDQGATAVVDYAHTPDALEKALSSLRLHCRGLLWVVFGCGGDRDRGKRPQMGSIAESLANHVILTDDNPRSEDGDAIIADIIGGCKRRDITVQRDRHLAITYALEQLGPDDVLLIAGKGHEDTQEIKGVKQPFSDREVVTQWLGLAEKRRSVCA